MPDFVINNTTLAGPKVAWDGASTDVAAPDMWCRHTDYNELRDAANSLRSWVKPGGVGFTPGSYTLATLTVGANGNITAIAAGTGLTDGDKGDVVVSAGSSVFTIDTAVVTPAKMSAASASSFLGNITGSPAAPAYMTVAQARTLLGLATVATTGSGADLTANSVANTKLAQMAANTVKANLTGGLADPTDATVAALTAAITAALLAGPGNFGDGSNGAVTFDGVSAVTGWTRVGTVYSTTKPDWFYTTVTISSGVTLCMEVGGEGTGGGASGRLFSSQGITVTSGTATIKLNGPPGNGNVAGTSMTTGHTGAVAGPGAGGIQNAGQNAANPGSVWPTSFRGGAGGFGGASATNAGSNTAAVANSLLADTVGSFNTWAQASLGRINMGNGGPIGGGAGGGSGGGTTGIASGGAGGHGGGVLIVGARKVTGTLVIQAKGGAGGNGVPAAGSNAGGGSSGGGGFVIFGVGTATMPGNVTLDASAGAAGTPQGTGTAGGVGLAGQTLAFPLGPS